MTLIDTSLWVEFFRKKGHPDSKQRVSDLMVGDLAAYTCPVLFELLAGARDKVESDLVQEALGLCERLPFEVHMWERAAQVEQALRKKGALVPRDDIFVAVVAAEREVPLLCRDTHFNAIQRHALPKLQVIQA
jgi:predicted nucleic acid-binding protein